MKGILHAELEIPFHDVDSISNNCWHGNYLFISHQDISQ